MGDALYPSVPRAAVAAVVVRAGKVLLIKRATPPRQGSWTLPGGSIDLGETLQQAAQREVLEETGLTVRAKEPVHCFEVITHDEQGNVRFHYVIVDLVADYVSGELAPNDEVDDAGWFEPGALAPQDVDADTLALIRRCVSASDGIPP